MSAPFPDLLKELFPSITTQTKDALKNFILRYQTNPDFFFATSLLDRVSQGDILTNIPFVTLQKDELLSGGRLFAMAISCNCNYDQGKNVILAPAYTPDFFIDSANGDSGLLASLRKNEIFDKFYLPSNEGCPELIIDFNGINSYKREYIEKTLNDNKSERVYSLSQTGYWYLICKLTVHFCRPETEDAIREDKL